MIPRQTNCALLDNLSENLSSFYDIVGDLPQPRLKGTRESEKQHPGVLAVSFGSTIARASLGEKDVLRQRASAAVGEILSVRRAKYLKINA